MMECMFGGGGVMFLGMAGAAVLALVVLVLAAPRSPSTSSHIECEIIPLTHVWLTVRQFFQQFPDDETCA